MPPNVSSSRPSGTIETEVRKRHTTNESSPVTDSKPHTSKLDEFKSSQTNSCKSKSSKNGKCARTSAILLGVTVILVASFLYLPWESYLFSEEELQNYIDMLEEGGDGDWIMRQFLATTDQNYTEAT
jgi:hypothetical protein